MFKIECDLKFARRCNCQNPNLNKTFLTVVLMPKCLLASPSWKLANILAASSNVKHCHNILFGFNLYNYPSYKLQGLDLIVMRLLYSFGMSSSRYPF
jgi:hypothetical protein